MGKALTVDDYRLRPELHHVPDEGDDGLDERLHATYAWAGPEVASSTPERRGLDTYAGRHQDTSSGGSRDGAVQAARRARGEIDVQSEAKDRGSESAREQHADQGSFACPAAPAATPNLRRDGAKTTKYSTRDVLHDFIRSDKDFGRM